MSVPLIGLSMDQDDTSDKDKCFWIKKAYVEAIQSAGGAALLLPASRNAAVLEIYLEKLSGLVITGGDFDVPPDFYGEDNDGGTRNLIPDRSAFELKLVEKGWERKLPMLGVCGGMQLMNVFRGGTLSQHIENHENLQHRIKIHIPSLLGELLNCEECTVSSSHHQAVNHLGRDLTASAFADDGTVEAIEMSQSNEPYFFLGVQWHPEAMLDNAPEQMEIYLRLIREAKNYQST